MVLCTIFNPQIYLRAETTSYWWLLDGADVRVGIQVSKTNRSILLLARLHLPHPNLHPVYAPPLTTSPQHGARVQRFPRLVPAIQSLYLESIVYYDVFQNFVFDNRVHRE